MNTKFFCRLAPLAFCATALMLVLPTVGSAQSNDKKALRQASGNYRGEEGPVGQDPFAFGTAKIKFAPKGKTARATVIEDAPSTVNTSGEVKVKKAKVKRGGKKIVLQSKRGTAIENMGSEFFAAFTGTSSGTLNRRGKKFSGEAIALIENDDDVFFRGSQ